MHESVVRNCEISARAGDGPLFVERADGAITANLEGYVIRPIEELQELAARRRDESAGGVDPHEPALPI
ncbi:hypothetical protein [Hydrogenophaga palleronii]|uniref:hypothetical protein n=1 Tax=Hydrogenophaga palleronii TaxID=65655 RepID=UPI0012ED9FD4|nr:hypothetical protein [Hydrogenophaga palleronii]